MQKYNTRLLLLLIFVLAIILRFLFFPSNLYFGYDQARDAFAAKDILSGDLKIVGPSTSVTGLYHGALYYYLITPFYLIGGGNPEVVSAALRILNATGIFIVFLICFLVFNRSVGLLAALLFALSFEQTQFAIYLSNPALASLSIPIMFLGFALVIFKNKDYGLPLAFLGLGLSIQFEFALFYLIVPFIICLVVFYKHFLKIQLKIWLITVAVFTGSIFTFLLAEIRYSYRTFHTLLNFSNLESNVDLAGKVKSYLYTINKMGEFNLYNNFYFRELFWILIAGFLFYLIWKKNQLQKLLFMCIWFFSLIFIYLLKGGYSDLYYTNIGISSSLIIYVSFLVYRLYRFKKVSAYLLMGIIAIANLNMIFKFNPNGTISQIHVQQGMLLSDQKKIMDKIYQDANGEPFAVKALTMPLNINTTWSYLFEWYGIQKYGYLPIWNGYNAAGYPGNIQVIEIQEKLPETRYLIIEPLRGIPNHLIDSFIREEGYFTNVISEENIGKFVLQKRKHYVN